MTSADHPPENAPDSTELEAILQRIFQEKDPIAHKAAIWELLHLSGDWELYERIAEFGGSRGITAYFQSIVERIDGVTETDAEDESIASLETLPAEEQDQIRELYASPLVCLRCGDWSGSAAAIHEILLNEIYGVYSINETDLAFGEATAYNLQKWVGEEVLFPLSIIEFLAYSDILSVGIEEARLDNLLVLLLTLFFSAQAHLDLETGQQGMDISLGGLN